MKRIVRKLFPKLYLLIASVKGNVKYCYKEYLELKRQNQCIVSLSYTYIS